MADSILSIGLQGVQNGLANANQAARDIVSATTADSTGTDNASTSGAGGSGRDGLADIATAAVELKISEHQVKASAAVIKTADEMMGTLVDIKA